MTSPVDFISGPSTVSTPGKRLNGNTASLTATWWSFFSTRLKLARLSPAMMRQAILAMGSPMTLATKGTVRRGARVHFEDVDDAVLERVLHVHQAADLEGEGELGGLALELGDDFGARRLRRQRAGAVARVDAGFLDVLHDAADEDVLAVAEAIDVDLDGAAQIAVEQQRVVARGPS